MGASKRVAELIVQTIGAGSKTRFVIVRFGNVLGSNGSVIPRMMDQIREGGPVTVTHPDVRRYFMLIPEAVQLVLHAAGLARDRETYVLDMGDQLKVLDVARNLIRLSGFIPDEEIKIRYIGMRPGEKLVEELFSEGERLEPAGAEKILRVGWPDVLDPNLTDNVKALVRFAEGGESLAVMKQLCRIVPTFKRPASDTASNPQMVPFRLRVPVPDVPSRPNIHRAQGTMVSK
jgi:FlaA1/EpsC-like NDP-sugar epimerase